ARFVDEERARGWHVHYDQILEGESFIQDPRTLISFDPRRFDRDFLIERLSGIGIEPASGAASLTIRSDNAPVDSFYRVEGRGKNVEEVAEKALGESSTAARGDAQRYARSYATTYGDIEAQLADLKLLLLESQEREQRLIDRTLEAEERLADGLATEHELR